MLSNSGFFLHESQSRPARNQHSTAALNDSSGSRDTFYEQDEDEDYTENNTIDRRQRQANANMQYNRRTGHFGQEYGDGGAVNHSRTLLSSQENSPSGQPLQPPNRSVSGTPSMRRRDLVNVGRSHAH